MLTILGVLSTVLAKGFCVSPKEGWIEPINIYTLIALPPANNKSLVLKICTEPLEEWELAQSEALSREVQEKKSQRKIEERHLEVLRSRACKIKEATARRAAEREIIDLEMKLTEPPVIPSLYISDATNESFGATLHDQGGRLAVITDEGGIIETMSGLYTQGNSNIDIFLKGIDGGSHRLVRNGRQFNVSPFVTMILVVQPAVLLSMFKKTGFCRTRNGRAIPLRIATHEARL